MDLLLDPRRINLPAFEGPLDLLLYLIKKEELDIWDIPIATITERYLAYLEQLTELDLDVAGEFLVMAATLAMIKSRMLLPQLTADGEELAEDPRTVLVEMLLEYQRYKEAARALAELPLLGREVFERGQPGLFLPEGIQPVLPRLELYDLVKALQDVMARARARALMHQVSAERFSVVERIHWLHDRLRTGGSVSFRDLFSTFETRMDTILTFLALLEMLKAHILHLEPLETEGEGEEQRVVNWWIGERDLSRLEAMDLSGIDELPPG